MNGADFPPKRKILIAGTAAIAAAKARGLKQPVLNKPEKAKPAAKKRHPVPKARVEEIFAILRQRWPAAFVRPHPLRLGVFGEVAAALDGVVDPIELKIVFKLWSNGRTYLGLLAEGAGRIHLDGELSGEIPTDYHRKIAAKRLAERAAKRSGAK